MNLFEVAFIWELTKETIHLPLGCLQGGERGLGYRRGLTGGGAEGLVGGPSGSPARCGVWSAFHRSTCGCIV